MTRLYETLGPLVHDYLRFKQVALPRIVWNGRDVPPGDWRTEWTDGANVRQCTGGSSPIRAVMAAFHTWRGVVVEEATIPLTECSWIVRCWLRSWRAAGRSHHFNHCCCKEDPLNPNLFSGSTPRADTVNAAGGRAFARTPKEALAQLAVTGTMGNTFHVSAEHQLNEILELLEKVPSARSSPARRAS
jgi:hypothetical protein